MSIPGRAGGIAGEPMTGLDGDSGLASYRRGDVVSYYANAHGLQPVEAYVFKTYIAGSARILDLGVGGGRTTPHLCARASKYVGVDYSPEMVDVCRRRFPEIEFKCHDAADLSGYDDASFDAVVFSFNGIGHLWPDLTRHKCLAEVARVLVPGGRFIFSLHNARGLLIRPSRRDKSVKATLQAIAAATIASSQRVVKRLSSATFWKGRGYLRHLAHGDERIHLATPSVVRTELAQFGLALVESAGEAYPRHLPLVASRWIYYVAEKRGSGQAGGALANIERGLPGDG